MNITTLSRLYTTCSCCGTCYYKTSHLKQPMKCKLCPEKLKDPINRIYYEEINQKIEDLYPRHMYDIFIKDGDLQIIANATTGPLCFMRLKVWEHVQKRITYRTRPGEWKRKRKNRKTLVQKSFSNTMNDDAWSHIFSFLSWKEITVMYKCFVAQKD